MRPSSHLRARLEALERKLITPLQRRLETLTPADRAIYEACQRMRAAWCRQFVGPGELYAAIVNGRMGPQMPRHVEQQLFPAMPTILTSDTDAEAAEKWRQAMEGAGT